MVEIVDDVVDMVAASSERGAMDANATGQFDSAMEDDPYQETSLANELRQMDQDRQNQAASQAQRSSKMGGGSALDEDAIPFNIQDYLTKHQVSVQKTCENN